MRRVPDSENHIGSNSACACAPRRRRCLVVSSARFSRRRLLALAGGATAATALCPARVAARQAANARPAAAPRTFVAW